MLYKASAPGSLMLLGEYAVLHDKTAIVCALDKRIEITLRPRNDAQINIHSSLGNYHIDIKELALKAPFEFVLSALKAKQKKLPSGCDITINAALPSHLGLGSSGAVTVALVAALNLWLGQTTMTKEHLWQEAKAVVLAVQGNGSGADIAASIYGGVIAFRSNPLHVTALTQAPPICAVYSGKKTTTKNAIEIVKQHYAKNPQHFENLFNTLDQLAQHAIAAINNKNWQALGHLFNDAQQSMSALGVTNAILENIIQTLRTQPDIVGAKISGSGLGDCAIGLGRITKGIFPVDDQQKALGVTQIPLTIATQGVSAGEC